MKAQEKAKNGKRRILHTRRSIAPQWVKVGFVTDLTGWDCWQLRRAREQGVIEFEKREDGFWYNVNSLNTIFLKHA